MPLSRADAGPHSGVDPVAHGVLNLTLLHILAGSLALIAGAMSMFATKGGRLHKQSGNVFVAAMLIMSASATALAVLQPKWLSALAGVLAFYLVCTAWLTVRRPVREIRGLLAGLMGVALAVGALLVKLGIDAWGGHGSRGVTDSPGPYFVFGGVALIAACMDARLLRLGSIAGPHRLARHLWRMGFAMLMATASLFLGQTQVFPQPLRNFGLLALPVLAVALFMVYWLVHVARRRHLAVRTPEGA